MTNGEVKELIRQIQVEIVKIDNNSYLKSDRRRLG